MRSTGNMKAFLILAIILAFLAVSGCETSIPRRERDDVVIHGMTAREVVIDSCTYIQWYKSLTHKGNCPNHVHIYRDSTEVR